MKMNRRIVPRMLMTVLMAFLLAAGCMGLATAEPLSTDGELWLISDEQLAEMETLPPEEEEMLFAPEEEPETPIETPYGTLYYPAIYTEDVVIDLAVGEDACTVSMLTTIDEKELKLFTLTLSKAVSEGFRLGTLGEVGVYLLMNEQKADDWSAEGFRKINELQESVNALLVQIYEIEGFTAGQ